MEYKLILTKRAEKLLDNILNYIIHKLKNEQAAGNLLTEIEHVYYNLERNCWMNGIRSSNVSEYNQIKYIDIILKNGYNLYKR
jgi:hypothetical protein